MLKTGEGLDRALTVLDRTLYTETHKIGLLYVREGQKTEEQILGNQTGSPRYHKVFTFSLNFLGIFELLVFFFIYFSLYIYIFILL